MAFRAFARTAARAAVVSCYCFVFDDNFTSKYFLVQAYAKP